MTQVNPMSEANFLSRYFFSWMTGFVWKNKNKDFEQEDHFDLLPEHQIKNLQDQFTKDLESKSNKFSFMVKQFQNFPLYLFLILAETAVQMVSIYIIYSLTEYFENLKENDPIDIQKIVLMIVGMLACQFFQSTAENYVQFRVSNDLVLLKNNYIVSILKKALRLNSLSPSKNFIGNVINLIQTDCQKFEEYGFALIYSVWAVFYIGSVFTASFFLINWVILVYLTVSIIFMVISGALYTKYMNLEFSLMAKRDERVTLLNNIFKNIRFVKFTVLENFFCKYVYDYKKKELSLLNKMYWITCVIVTINWINPCASIVATYIVYFVVFKKMTLKQYMSFYQISFSLEIIFMFLPWLFNAFLKFYVTLTRIGSFMDIDNNEREIVTADDDNSILKISNGNFSYQNQIFENFEKEMKKKDSEEEIETEPNNLKEPLLVDHKEEYNFKLKNIDLSILPGELVFVIGQIGSGKSSLLNAILGNMSQDKKSFVKIGGSCSFCPQQSFLLTDSIKNNITFFDRFDEEKLKQVIKVSHLESDLEKFEGGMEKVCTEHGMNLSGGQRLRVNLARTIYQEKDIYIFDDPFSALDIHVASAIIEDGIVDYLKGKTRIVVTHSIQYLKYADKIVYMDQGSLKTFESFEKFKQTEIFQNLKNTLKQQEEQETTQEQEDEEEKEVQEKTEKITEQKETKEDEYIKKYFLEEDKEKGRKFSLVLKFLNKYFGGPVILTFVFLIALVPNICFYIGLNYFYDFIKNQDTSNVDIVMYNYASIMILPCFLSFFRFLIQMFFQLQMVKKLHHKMMIYATHGGLLNFFDKIPIARLLNRFTNDLNNLEDEFIWTLNGFIINCAMFSFSAFVALISISPFLAIVFIMYFYLCFVFQNLYISMKKDIYRLENITKTPIVNLTKQIVEGRQVIQVLNKEKSIINKLEELIDDNNKNIITKNALSSWFFSHLSIFNVVILQSISYTVAIILLQMGLTQPKGFIISISYFLSIIYESKNFLENISNLETSIVCLERCEAFQQIPQEESYKNFRQIRSFLNRKMRFPLSCFVPKKFPGNRLQRLTYEEINNSTFKRHFIMDGKISYKNVFAKYPIGNDYALKDVSLEIQQGEKIGICGQTGSGKTTLIKLLTQYLSYEKGSVTVDGYEISEIDAKKLRSEILIVSQEIALFEGTILENLNPQYIQSKDKQKSKQEKKLEEKDNQLLIDQGLAIDPEYEKEIIQCFIDFGFSQQKLTKGLQFKIENGGNNLSSGEQQLIAMFRALFSEKKIIILDEATSQIDYQTEEKIIQYLYKKIHNKTMISIAHRVNTILGCDRIIVLQDGVIVEQGQTQELLTDSNSKFYKMYQKINQNLS